MIIEEIIMADCTGILLMLILLVSRYFVRRKQNVEDKFFYAMVLVGLFAGALELTAFLVDGKPGTFAKVVNILVNVLIYGCTTTLSVVWLWYVDSNLNHDTRRIRTVWLPYVIVYGVLMVLLVVNLFTGFFYVIDANNVYNRRPLGYIYYAFLFICFITTIIIYIKDRIVYGETKFFPIFTFLVPVILGCIIQAVWYGIATGWLGCAIGLTAIYLNIQSRFALVDHLTGLYNRSFIEHKLLVARRKSNRFIYGGIMLDIDCFKQINDTYGHSVGDEALRQVAKILVDASDNKNLIFRFAGDEFVILLRAPISEKAELEARMILLEKAIREEADAINNQKEALYKLEFSFGRAFFDASKDDDEFFRTMDLEMYKEKRKHHRS